MRLVWEDAKNRGETGNREELAKTGRNCKKNREELSKNREAVSADG